MYRNNPVFPTTSIAEWTSFFAAVRSMMSCFLWCQNAYVIAPCYEQDQMSLIDLLRGNNSYFYEHLSINNFKNISVEMFGNRPVLFLFNQTKWHLPSS